MLLKFSEYVFYILFIFNHNLFFSEIKKKGRLDGTKMVPPLPAPMPVVYKTDSQYVTSSSSANGGFGGTLKGFGESYEHMCSLQSIVPLQAIKSCISTDGSVNLALNADKLK